MQKKSIFDVLRGKEKKNREPVLPGDALMPAGGERSPVTADRDTAGKNAVTASPENGKDDGKDWFSRLKAGLSKTSGRLTDGISDIFTKSRLEPGMLEELSDLLIGADLGAGPAARITDSLAGKKFDRNITGNRIRKFLAEEVGKIMAVCEKPLEILPENRPHVIVMAGVNGAGKTTTIAKLARQYKDAGLQVMLAAGDTFRAAAVEQLAIWGERTGVPVVTGAEGADAASVAYDAMERARREGMDVLLVDTAGRLQNKSALMEQLAKIIRVIGKQDDTAPHDVILVLDATVGQNALAQVRTFSRMAGVTGCIMTKLDGTARGGVLVALADEFSLPVHYIGVGEKPGDLQPFSAGKFASALVGIQI